MITQAIQVVRGDTTVLAFTYSGDAPTQIRFYIKKEVDGETLVALSASEQPAQFAVSASAISVTLKPADTDGQPACTTKLWVYDLEVTTTDGVTTVYGGTCRLDGDIATTAVAAALISPLLGVTVAQAAALDAAATPGTLNPLITASALAAELADYAPDDHTHGGGDVTSAVASATDADTVDGEHAAAFADASHTHAGAGSADREFCFIAEFAGAVLQADGGDNVGTLTAAHDATDHRNYYDWTTAEASTQDYDLVLQWRLPPEFSSWRAEDAHVYVTSRVSATPGATGVRLVELLDAGGTNRLTAATKQNAAWTADAFAISGGTWAAGDLVTLRVRLLADAGKAAQLHEVRLPWTAV